MLWPAESSCNSLHRAFDGSSKVVQGVVAHASQESTSETSPYCFSDHSLNQEWPKLCCSDAVVGKTRSSAINDGRLTYARK